MIDPPRVRVEGPLRPFAAGFAVTLSRQGYTPSSVGHQLWLLAHLSRWLGAARLEPAALSPENVERFLIARRAAGYATYASAKALAPLLLYLRELGVAPAGGGPAPSGPVEELLCCYGRYLELERGLMASTAHGYIGHVRPFLESMTGSCGEVELGGLDARQVHAFVLARCPRQGRSAAKATVQALRSLLGFLHMEGLIEGPLAGAVPSVAGWRLASLPKALSTAQIESLLVSCDTRVAAGRRDYAILVMLARMGLRRGEVAALTLDAIDWRAGEIVVVGKGARSDALPLPADVGEAISNYLRRGRPATAQDRNVFVRIRAPHQALSPNGVGAVVVAAARRAGLGQLGSHRLRHTAATEMLRAGASLPEIGQVLRHHRLETTAIYAKVDRRALRCLARPWVGGAS